MKKFYTLIAFIVLFVQSTGMFGQIFFSQGYIIGLKNDTTYGLISDRGKLANSQVCVFKDLKTKQIRKYSAYELKLYRFLNGKYYISKELRYENRLQPVFCEVLVEGKMNLLYFGQTSTSKYYIELGNLPLKPLIYESYKMKKQTEKAYSVYNERYLHINYFQDTLFQAFSDCKIVQEKVDRLLPYDIKPIMNLVKEYNSEVCNNKNTNSYEKDTYYSRPHIGFMAGAQFTSIAFMDTYDGRLHELREESFVDPLYVSMPVGVFCNFPLSLINERYSFQLEAVASKINYKVNLLGYENTKGEVYDSSFNVSSTVFSLPLMLQYKNINTRITPLLGIGNDITFIILNKKEILHWRPDRGWFAEAGCEMRVNRFFSVFSKLRFQYNNNMVLENDMANRISFSQAYQKYKFTKFFRTYTVSFFTGISF